MNHTVAIQRRKSATGPSRSLFSYSAWTGTADSSASVAGPDDGGGRRSPILDHG